MRKTIFSLLFLACLTMLTCSSCRRKKDMPIEVFPFYNYKPRAVNLGKDSEILMSDSIKRLRAYANDIRGGADSVPIEKMYVLSIRLFDLGEKEDGAYWYYCAQFRTRVACAALSWEKGDIGNDTFEKVTALMAFQRLIGEHVNKFLAENKDTWINVCQRCMDDCKGMSFPDSLYPNLPRNDSFDLEKTVREVVEGLDELMAHIRNESQEDVLPLTDHHANIDLASYRPRIKTIHNDIFL